MPTFVPSNPLIWVTPAATYLITTTAGTSTAKPGPGIYYGSTVLTAGTNSTMGVFDGTTGIIPTSTNTAVGAVTVGLPAGVGAACATSVVIVATGTAVATTAHWFA